MLDSIRRRIQKFHLIPSGSKLVVGVSGGADSLALLHILYTSQAWLGCSLHVVTLDHGLRGDEGAADVRFVVQTAKSWGLPVTAGQVNVKELAKRDRISIETAARRARYDFLADVAQQIGADGVAVAHHAGDQAETVLMHLIRGAGLGGLGGMSVESPVPGHTHLRLIRPLLWVTRKQIVDYCRENGLIPREDASNTDVTLLRNYIRLETLPHLEKLNPNIQNVLMQLAEIARVEHDYLNEQLQTWVSSENVQVGIGRIAVNRTSFRNLHPSLQRRIVNWAARQISTEIENLGYLHIIEAVELGLHGRQGAIALLTEGIHLRVDYEWLVFEHQDTPLPVWDQPVLLDNHEMDVVIPGETRLPDRTWTLVASFEPMYPASEWPEVRLTIPEVISVILRGRRPGDRFAPPGLGSHTQKLNRWMINRKIPLHLRDQLPLLCVDGNVAAIYMDKRWFVSEKYADNVVNHRIINFHFRKNS